MATRRHNERHGLKQFIAYLRVSTAKQGAMGAGMEAQRQLVERYVESQGGELLETFTDVDSGGANNRDGLKAAMAACRKSGATLVVAKLDRLSRRVSFIAMLLESGLDFVVAEMPEATPLMLHIHAAMAEWELGRISERTREALAVKKAEGVRLGNPRWQESVATARECRSSRRSAYRAEITPIVKRLRDDGLSYQEIADRLNAQGFAPVAASVKTAKDGSVVQKVWYRSTVHRIIHGA